METNMLFIDIETDGYDRLLLLSWALNESTVRAEEEVTSEVAGLLRDPTVVKVSHSKYDLRWLAMHGVEVAGPLHDTMVMAWVLDENQPLDLQALTLKYLGPDNMKHSSMSVRAGRVFFGPWALDEYGHNGGWPSHAVVKFLDYAMKDVKTLRDLYVVLRQGLRAQEWEDYWLEEEVPYSGLLLNMELEGLPVDLAATEEFAAEVRGEVAKLEKRLKGSAGLPDSFNLDSPKQLAGYLFNKWYTFPARVHKDAPVGPSFEEKSCGRVWRHGVVTVQGRGLSPTPETDSGQPSTASPELLYKHPNDLWVQTLCLEYRRMKKLLGTYLEKFPTIAREGRIYGNFNQTGTVTGRLSSSGPNLQNIPARRELGKRTRALFKGNLVIGDYDSLEMRLMAHFSKDPALLRVFKEGLDPHAETAKAVFGFLPEHDDPHRDMGKTLNYAVGYGAGPKRLAQTMTLAGYPTTMAQAKAYLEAIKDAYPALYRWKNKVIWNAKETRGVTTIGGHRRRIPDLHDTNFKAIMYGERQAVNSIVQGSAADILRRVMLRVVRDFPELRLIAQVHDELLWEYDEPPTEDRLQELQWACEHGHGFNLLVPLSFVPGICDTWKEKGEVELIGESNG